MNEELIHYKYIKTLLKISKEELQNNKDTIMLFNIYVSSNKNFKYNKTYLNDSIEDFFNICMVFKTKQTAVMQFLSRIITQCQFLGDWYIIIDHVFLLENNKMTLIVDKLEDDKWNNPFKRKRLQSELEQFNLYNLDKKKFVVKYCLDIGSDHVDFTEECNIENKLEVSEFVKCQLETKEEKDEK